MDNRAGAHRESARDPHPLTSEDFQELAGAQYCDGPTIVEERAMAVLMRQTMPEGVTVQMLDAVSDEMSVSNDPPAGMVVHVHYEQDGRTEVVDVWESRQAYETFAAERLMPAMEKVAGDHGMPVPSEGTAGTPNIIDVHAMVRGR